MQKGKDHLDFLFVVTQDGSPTLRLTSPEGESESMHSLRGAFSETVYIYGAAIERCLKERFEPRILSLGLGLGYVELLAVALQLRDAPTSEFGGESFELLPELREFFYSWTLGELEKVPADFVRAYDEILDFTARATGIESSRIRSQLAELLKTGRWVLSGPLDAKTEVHGPFGCLCFDAFSSKTSPDLWTEEFLDQFFAKVAAPGCVLSTYACTGALKRTLKANRFDVTIRAGFGSKRDSTFAVRELSLS
jgi:S-adenosyl-L-methionine-dependent methyltransferase